MTELPFPKGLRAVLMGSKSQPREKTLLQWAPDLSCPFLLIGPLKVFVEEKSRKGLYEEKWRKKIEDEGVMRRTETPNPDLGTSGNSVPRRAQIALTRKNGPCSTKRVPSVDLRVLPVWVVPQSPGLTSS